MVIYDYDICATALNNYVRRLMIVGGSYNFGLWKACEGVNWLCAGACVCVRVRLCV